MSQCAMYFSVSRPSGKCTEPAVVGRYCETHAQSIANSEQAAARQRALLEGMRAISALLANRPHSTLELEMLACREALAAYLAAGGKLED